MKHVSLGLGCLCLVVACKAIPQGHDHNLSGNNENASGQQNK